VISTRFSISHQTIIPFFASLVPTRLTSEISCGNIILEETPKVSRLYFLEKDVLKF
jgi:hypothetical protein